MTYSILMVGVVGDTADVSTSFLGTILRLQQSLGAVKDTIVKFEFCHTVKDAIGYFGQSDADRLIILDGMMGVDVEWILKRHPKEFDEVIPAYPLREIRWDAISRLREKGVTDPEALRRESYVYNFTPLEDTTDCVSQSYLKTRSAQAKIVSLSKKGASTFLERYCPYSKRVEDTVVDLSSKGVNSGPFDFVGCVGTRLLSSVKV